MGTAAPGKNPPKGTGIQMREKEAFIHNIFGQPTHFPKRLFVCQDPRRGSGGSTLATLSSLEQGQHYLAGTITINIMPCTIFGKKAGWKILVLALDLIG